MTTSLHQVLPLARKAKAHHATVLGEAYKAEQRGPQLSGQTRTYQPFAEDGLQYPSERVLVQVRVTDLVNQIHKATAQAIDYAATVDATNSVAKADLVIDDEVIAENVPGVALLGLEKFLVDLRTFITKLPTLDPALEWTYDANQGVYRSEQVTQIRNEKAPKVIVKYDATDKHPAQTELLTLDAPVGVWTTTRFSGAIPVDVKVALVENVDKVADAVTRARAKANETPVLDVRFGDRLMDLIFEPITH